MLIDRRAGETQVTDEGIELRAASRISDKLGDKGHVNVTSYNRLVLLTGEVPNAAAKDDAEAAVKLVANVKSISNELAIGESSAFSARSNDAYITSKVKARFLDYKRFNANHVKVVTEAGVVFLMGLVTLNESNSAVEIARTTGGVKKVVRLFEIITPEAAMAADGKTPAAPAP
ncbi:MAG: BON domain-containing protein [Rhodocyclaceae bacterium]|nr:BON domain-containing protein [Rhodocyclaceae bacterium]